MLKLLKILGFSGYFCLNYRIPGIVAFVFMLTELMFKFIDSLSMCCYKLNGFLEFVT